HRAVRRRSSVEAPHARDRVAAARERDQHLLALEHRVDRIIAEADSVPDALQMVMRAISESEGWECCRCFLLGEAKDELVLAHAWHVPDAAVERFVKASHTVQVERGRGFVGKVWSSGEPLWSVDLANDSRALKRSHSLQIGFRAALDFPILAE